MTLHRYIYIYIYVISIHIVHLYNLRIDVHLVSKMYIKPLGLISIDIFTLVVRCRMCSCITMTSMFKVTMGKVRPLSWFC